MIFAIFTFILIIFLCYLWVKFIYLLFESPKRIKVRKSKFPEKSIDIQEAKTSEIFVSIKYIDKGVGNFAVIIRIHNIGQEILSYKIEDIFYLAENGLQIKSDTVTLINEIPDCQILPSAFIEKRVFFSDGFSNFSENDLLIIKLQVNSQETCILKTTLKNNGIKIISL